MGGMKERGSGGGFQGTEFVSDSKDTNKTVYENGNVYVSITCDIYVYVSLTLSNHPPIFYLYDSPPSNTVRHFFG